MHERAAQLIESLGLAPHPEGGWFRRVFYSGVAVQPCDGRPERRALSTIYFLLVEGAVSRWHRVGSDEAWHHYEGDPLELFVADPGLGEVTRRVLGPVAADAQPVAVVPADYWQAARTRGGYILAGCTVGPGFEYQDFELLRDQPHEAERLRRRHPDGMDGMI